MLSIGQTIEVEITDLNHAGQGVARVDNFVVFINGAVKGDIAEIIITEKKKNFAVGKLLKIIKSSKNRIQPPCRYFNWCGGCQLMHIDYKEQLNYKKSRVVNELKKAKVNIADTRIYDTVGMERPFRYRNKNTFSVTEKNGEICIGPYEQYSYNTVDIDRCIIQSREADKAAQLFKNLMLKYNVQSYNKNTGKGIVRNIVIRSTKNDQLMFIIVTVSKEFKNKNMLVKDFVLKDSNIKTVIQNINSKGTNLVMGRKNIVLYGRGVISDSIGDLNFTISTNTFFQVNHIQTEKLYQKAVEYADIKKDDICFDIYCGIGTISLMAAKYAEKVYGVEIAEQSVVNARKNAVDNNVGNAEFYSGKAEQIVPMLYKQNIKANVVILDPPRKGCEKKVIQTIISMSPERIVYVSCNPSTLSRDIKLLESGGYILKQVQPLDMFPWSVHVESIILMTYCGSGDKN